MSASPAISVLLPFHNAESTLDAALRSIIAQTWRELEVIAFDDGSEDGSAAVAARTASADARIRLFRSPHIGIVAALQASSVVARGAFLARMDADDVSHPRRFELQMALMRAQPSLAVCGTRVRIVGATVGPGRRRYERWINRLTSPEELARELFVECPIAHPTFLMRCAAFEAVGGYEDHGWPEDYDLLMRFFLAGLGMGKTPEVLFEWRERPGRLSMTDKRYSAASFRALKRRYLFQTCLSEGRAFWQWGAGEVGKRWLREWQDRRPEAVIDVHPRKIVRNIHGFRVMAPEQLPCAGEAFVVAAVGARGARDEIRLQLAGRGYVELRDFIFVA